MDTEKLRAALRKQGIVLHEGDPILATGEICEAALVEAVARLDAAVADAAARMNSASSHALASAKEAAGGIITSAADWMAEQLRAAGAEVAATVIHEVHSEVMRAEAAGRVARRFAWIAGCAAVLTAAGLVGFLVATL